MWSACLCELRSKASVFPVDDSGRPWEDSKAFQHICELSASRSSTGCRGDYERKAHAHAVNVFNT